MSHFDQIVAYRVRQNLGFEADVRAESLDCGNALGVAVALGGGRRHAVRTQLIDCDLTKAADEAAAALNDWHGQ